MSSSLETTWEPPALDDGVRLAPGSSGTEVRWTVLGGRSVVVKRAGGRFRGRLRREATVLAELSGPGVVELVACDDTDDYTEVIVADAGRRTLADPDGLGPDELGAAVRHMCAAVAHLHDRGWAHGGLDSGHVVVGRRGRVRLCSLGSAVTLSHDPAAAQRDALALVTLIDRCAHGPIRATSMSERRRRRRLRRALTRVVAGAARDGDRLTAHALVASVGVALSKRSHGTGRRPRPLRTILVAIGAAGLAVGAVSSAAVARSAFAGREQTDAAPRSCAAVTARSPDVDADGCGDALSIDGQVISLGATRFRVGLAGDIVAIGDWDCDGRATPALLRPATGEVLAFRRWARPGTRSTADVLARVDHAVNIRSEPANGCDAAVVTRNDDVEVVVGPHSPGLDGRGRPEPSASLDPRPATPATSEDDQ